MKSIYNFGAGICALMLFATSCTDSMPYAEEEYNNTYLSLPSDITIKDGETNGEFDVYSYGGWWITDYPYWLNLSQYSGSGYTTVHFTVDEYHGSYNRYDNLRVITDNYLKEGVITITQEPTTPFDAYMNTTEYKAEGDWSYLYVEAGASKSWTITRSDSWVHLGYSSNTSSTYTGTGNASVRIYVDENPYSSSRSSMLRVTCGTKTETITITQDKKSSQLTIYDGTVTSYKIPAYVLFWDDYTRSQCVYPKTRLTAMNGKKIKSITFYTTGSVIPYESVSVADVYVKEISYTSISSFVTKSSSTKVYSGHFSFVGQGNGGKVTITFSTPYTYQGGNLLIGIENTTDLEYKGIQFYGQTVSGASISGYNSSSLSSVSPSQQDFLPKATFAYE